MQCEVRTVGEEEKVRAECPPTGPYSRSTLAHKSSMASYLGRVGCMLQLKLSLDILSRIGDSGFDAPGNPAG